MSGGWGTRSRKQVEARAAAARKLIEDGKVVGPNDEVDEALLREMHSTEPLSDQADSIARGIAALGQHPCLTCHHDERDHHTLEDGTVGSCTLCGCDKMTWELR